MLVFIMILPPKMHPFRCYSLSRFPLICTPSNDYSLTANLTHCPAHRGGRRCQEEGCPTFVVGKTINCMAHGGRTRCEEKGCRKGPAWKSARCTTHGGGRRCQHEGCSQSAIGKTLQCKAHGGGSRKQCQREGCCKATRNKTACFCEQHGLGRLQEAYNATIQLSADRSIRREAARKRTKENALANELQGKN